MIYRIFTEKKKGFDVASAAQREELSTQLGIPSLRGLRIINRYDVNLDPHTDFKQFVYAVFAEINQDEVYFDDFPRGEQDKIFAVRYQPGQYDARSDAAAQCIRLVDTSADAEVRHMKIFVLTGEVSEYDIQKIQQYIINPVDSELVRYDSEVSFEENTLTPSVRVVQEGFTKLKDDELSAYISENSLAMDVFDCKAIRDYFSLIEKRDPTLTEIKVLDTYWSDHCRHTTFSTIIDSVEFGEGLINKEVKAEYESYLKEKNGLGRAEKPTTLMDLASIGTRIVKARGLGSDIEESDEINACSYFADVTIDGKSVPYLIMFKNETHNHPTEIEPFGGAATCLGGAIRDPLAGRSYVYQSMRVTGSADPRLPIDETPHGKLPQRKITTQAAAGFSSYGNQIGLCTGQVKEYYHPRFFAKRMEVGAVIGAAPAENVVRKTPEAGDIIYIIGGRTGRDGIGGASGSSKAHTEKSVDTAGSEVQKGNAPQERKLQRLFRRGEFARLIKKCNDFGAGGVSVAIGELADSLDIDLDSVLLKYSGLNATELAISESQERMAVLIAPADEAEFLKYVREENLEYSRSAVVTDTGRLIMHFRGEEVLNLSRAFIDTNGTAKHTSVYVDMSEQSEFIYFPQGGFAERMLQMADDLNIASQKGLTERFDNTIGAGSVLMPYGGRCALTPSDVMAAKIPALSGSCTTASMMAHGYDPYLAAGNPYLGAYNASLSAVNKLVCAGAKYKNIKMSAQEYFGKLGASDKKWGEVFSALLGALKVQRALGIPAIGGKDSMSGTYENIDVPPTLIAFGAVVCEIDEVLTNVLQSPNSALLLLRPKKSENGSVDIESFRFCMDQLEKLTENKKILSAAALGAGGIAEAVVKMCMGNSFGFGFEAALELDELFLADYSASVMEVRKEDIEEILSELDGCGMLLGSANDTAIIRFGGESVKLSDYVKAWEAPLSGVFPIYLDEQNAAQAVSDDKKTDLVRIKHFARPRVFIPVFPGTNCEYDSARAFEEAGAEADVFVFKNNTAQDIIESAKEMARRIDNAQIVMFPGGFSAADEPDGSGKFIVSVLRNPYITEAIRTLISSRDGLILGVCNGFQALIKTGLLPYGDICELNEQSPTLTYNSIGRHVAKIVHTRIATTRSPWLSEVAVGDVHSVAISHGEGRFMANEQQIAELIKNSQVALQYCDEDGRVLGSGKVNPNLSAYNIEGIISPDGRILGKMGHIERRGYGLYKNAPGNFDNHIISSGVKYYD